MVKDSYWLFTCLIYINSTRSHFLLVSIATCAICVCPHARLHPNHSVHSSHIACYLMPGLYLYSTHLSSPHLFATWLFPLCSRPLVPGQVKSQNKPLCFTWTASIRGHSETRRPLTFSLFLSEAPSPAPPTLCTVSN